MALAESEDSDVRRVGAALLLVVVFCCGDDLEDDLVARILAFVRSATAGLETSEDYDRLRGAADRRMRDRTWEY